MSLRRVPVGLELPDWKESHWSWPKDGPVETAMWMVRGEPVALCRLFRRKLILAELSLDVLGIGGVYTPPTLRQAGFASTMLASLLHQTSAADGVAAVLWTRRGEFYERLGFVAIGPGLYAYSLREGLTFRGRRVEETFPMLAETVENWSWTLEPAGHF